MSPGRFQFPFFASAVCAMVMCNQPANSEQVSNTEANSNNPAVPATKVWQAEMADRPAPVEKHEAKHKLLAFAKGVGKEVATSVTDFGKDAFLLFSVQSIDPYDEKAPKNKPYRLLDLQLVDGTTASLIKYPDGSGRVVGGFADGTVIIPNGRDYVVKYPNGGKGRLQKEDDGTFKLFRPDDTVTTFKIDGAGTYSINNNKIGYMGEAIPSDETGLRYDLH